MSSRGLHLHGRRVAISAGPLTLDPGPDWMLDPTRGCNTGNADLFYPQDSDPDSDAVRSVNRVNQNKAKATCETCPFRRECALWALDNGERAGVWGGYVMSSTEDRQRAAADLGRTPPPAPEPGRRIDHELVH